METISVMIILAVLLIVFLKSDWLVYVEDVVGGVASRWEGGGNIRAGGGQVEI